jgi:hypothetical protein
MQRAVRHAVASGVTQFLDIGTGLPTGENVHEVARSADPGSRVVYVDNDPVVAAHARAILASQPGTTFLLADMQEPADIVAQAGAALDLSAPVAVMCISLLHFVPDDARAAAIVAALTEPLAPGSLLAFTHWKYLPSDEESAQSYAGSVAAIARRAEAEISALVPAGWDLVDPGLVPVTQWRPSAADLSAGVPEAGLSVGDLAAGVPAGAISAAGVPVAGVPVAEEIRFYGAVARKR